MRKAAIIVENRNLPYLDKVIQNHMDHLQGFDLIHYSDMIINSGHDYNNLIASPKFWEIDYDKIVIFQHDSMLLRDGVDEFLEYSFVGSPWRSDANWARKDRAGGNGGLSIRDVKAHLELSKMGKYNAHISNEDVFFTHKLENVAPYSVCVNFGVETEYQLGTFGCHAIDKHLTLEQQYKILHQYENP